MPADSTEVPALVTLDLTAPFAGVDELDDGVRDRIRDALRDYASAENGRTIMATIREVLAREAPEQTVVGVVFETMEFDNGYFVSTFGDALFTDGTTEHIDFRELDETFSDEFGARGSDFTVTVDLRPGTREGIDTDDYGGRRDIFERFGVPVSEDRTGGSTRPDTAASR